MTYEITTKSHARAGAIAIATIVLAVLTAGRADATTAFGCTPSKVKVVSQTPNTNRVTSSTVFVDVQQTATQIVQGGKSPGCVIVDFSAMVDTDPNVALNLSASLDGASGVPASTQLIYNSTVFEARSVSFVFNGVAPGTHTVKLRFHSSQSGQFVRINSSNIIIHYVP